MSDIRANTISDASGNGPINLKGQSAAKAWINFNGQTATAADDMTGVRNSFNISGLVDNGIGNHTPNMVNAMANNTYAVSCAISESGVGGIPLFKAGDGYTTTNFLVLTADILGATTGNTLTDFKFVQATLHGDLA